MVHTPFYNILLRKAFLFSCFCGLRHCDIIALRWEDIRYDENGNALLSIIQKKTKEAISLPLCSEAIKHLPDRGNAPETEKVFAGLVSLGRSNVILHKWVEQAGISKHVTFHTARHTHATMMLTLGVDLYTVSKLLGHTNIQTTQIYAKLVDESKKKAIDLIPKKVTVPAYTIVTLKTTTEYETSDNTISTVVDGKLYTIPNVKIKKVVKTVVDPVFTSTEHGHGHGHGNGNNAGGGDGAAE